MIDHSDSLYLVNVSSIIGTERKKSGTCFSARMQKKRVREVRLLDRRQKERITQIKKDIDR